MFSTILDIEEAAAKRYCEVNVAPGSATPVFQTAEFLGWQDDTRHAKVRFALDEPVQEIHGTRIYNVRDDIDPKTGAYATGLPESITCPKCSKTSYHPMDVAQKYCGNCHQFHENMGL